MEVQLCQHANGRILCKSTAITHGESHVASLLGLATNVILFFKGEILMTRVTKSLVIMALLVAMGGVVVAQDTLKEVVEQEGLGWLMGQWKTTTDDGTEIALTYRWAVNGHAIVSIFKMGERTSQGLIYFDAEAQEVKQFAIDSRGKATKSTWESEYGKAKVTTQMTDENGESTDVVIVYSKVSRTTINVAVHGVEYGVMSDNAAFESDFNKVKRQKKK
jgi:hypothetical protein